MVYRDGLQAGWPEFGSQLGQESLLFSSLLHSVQTGSEAHKAPCSLDAGGSFIGRGG
jgi:hypothetical protein